MPDTELMALDYVNRADQHKDGRNSSQGPFVTGVEMTQMTPIQKGQPSVVSDPQNPSFRPLFS